MHAVRPVEVLRPVLRPVIRPAIRVALRAATGRRPASPSPAPTRPTTAPRSGVAITLAAALAATASTTLASADGITVDLDTTLGRINGQAEIFVGGVPVVFAGFVEGGTIARFRVLGDLVLADGDRIVAFGDRGVSILVGDDVILGAGAEIDASATGSRPGPGGGSGSAGTPGGPGMPGANFTAAGGPRAFGGLGGAAGFGGFDGFTPSGSGLSGWDVSVPPALHESQSSPGGSGVNAPGSGGAGASGSGLAGAGGDGGDGGAPGDGGAGGASQGGNGSNGADGADGEDGEHGGPGATLRVGHPGANTGGGSVISGGGGGSGGLGGAGGGGGGSGGGAGGGGGGGGGGGYVQLFPPIVDAGSAGGESGPGGSGSGGGRGGAGGPGGRGGHGGGAMEIVAFGAITLDGILHARGGDGDPGQPGQPGLVGGSGFPGIEGSAGNESNDFGGDGGDGGDGGHGGAGGVGGPGGPGLRGGGGAAGTIKLVATVLDGAGTLDLRPGNLDLPATGGAGRLLRGTTGADAFAGDVVGAPQDAGVAGPTDANPFILADDPAPVPFIAGLRDGADVYGFAHPDAELLEVLLDGVAGAPSLVLRRLDALPVGLAGDDAGHDAIAIVNAGDGFVSAVALGLGTTTASEPLLRRGLALNPALGGPGPVLVPGLVPGAVWITVVPEDLDGVVLAGDGIAVAADTLADGDVLLLEPACPADLDGSGDVAFGDLTLVLAAWGTDGANGTDLDGDGTVDLNDLLAVLGTWGTCG